ncbi:MAG: RNA-binding protein [Spirochaetales bacterium]
MAKKLYVGNLSYSSDEAELQNLFSQYGEVTSVNIITDKMTGRARGFGFVEMATEEGAQAAIQATNGMELRGRQLRVNEALEQNRDRGNRSRGHGGFGGGYRDRY